MDGMLWNKLHVYEETPVGCGNKCLLYLCHRREAEWFFTTCVPCAINRLWWCYVRVLGSKHKLVPTFGLCLAVLL